MKINPQTMSWVAPKTNMDGTPIQYELQYEVGLVNAEGGIDPLMVIPGQLQTDGKYTAPISALGLDYGTYDIAIRTFAKEDPKRVSTWSDLVPFAISKEIPKAPLELAVY